ncbi:hypothetical protein GG344DRAFT_43738 [Lentinula edodes]|nr:hypothetical protein GG344DRAFT_43738 [Lentinula edodes]
MFYARPNFTPSRYIVVGLPLNRKDQTWYNPPKLIDIVDVLNRLQLSFGSKIVQDPDVHAQAEKSRRFSKYVFPRQYGLANASMFEVSKYEPSYVPDFADRDSEIERLGPCKTPKRVKAVLPLLEKLIWRHGKCKYRLLRDRSCPSKVLSQPGTASSLVHRILADCSLVENGMDGTLILVRMPVRL